MKSFLRFVNENLNDPTEIKADVPDEIVKFHLSDKFYKMITPLKNEYKVAELLFNLKEGVKRSILSKDPVDYLDMDEDGYISFLKSRYFTEPDLWTSTRRIKMKFTKVLKDIYNEPYINTYIKPTDIEAFTHKLISLKDKGCRIEEYRGMEILRAYNYKKELTKDFSYSCANFYQSENNFGKYTEPKVSEFDIYTKNPEQCGVVVVWDDGVIKCRRSFQQGIQVCDSGSYKKGEFHTVWGSRYGVGGKYDIMMTDYLKKKYPNATQMHTGPNNSAICISLETRFTYYCPFDSMSICFEHNLLSDNPSFLTSPYKNYNWTGSYHASCPMNLVKKRISEENSVDPKLDIVVKNLANLSLPKQPYKRLLTEKEFEMLCHYYPNYTWAKNIDADGKLIMNKRTTMPPLNEGGIHYLTEEDLNILTDKVVQPVIQKIVKPEVDQLQKKIKPVQNLDDWGVDQDKEDYHPTYYRDKQGRFRKKTS